MRDRALTRERLLDTAEAMFLGHGFAGITVDAVAQEAGFTTGAVYSNFGGKADLFVAVLERMTERELAAVRLALADARTDEQRLDVFNMVIGTEPARWHARVAATLEFLSYTRRHPELHARIRAAQDLADDAAGELIAAVAEALGVARPADVREAGRDFIALVNGLAMRSLFDAELDVRSAMSRGIHAMLTGDRTELRVAKGGAGRGRR